MHLRAGARTQHSHNQAVRQYDISHVAYLIDRSTPLLHEVQPRSTATCCRRGIMLKLKLGGNKASSPNGAAPPNSAGPPPSASSSGPPVKLKLNVSQPPTPIEQAQPPSFYPSTQPSGPKKKRPYQRKQDGDKSAGKKRAADEDISPAAKRAVSGPSLSRKLSLKPPPPIGGATTPGPKISLGKKRSSLPKILDIRARGKAPPRPKGVGYDSEDSDVEKDPAIQQAFVLRMEDGEDARYLREAIAAGKIGPHPSQGDAEVSLKFIEKNYRRAVVKVRGRMYAAVLVDLPCIVESMKSFDKKLWLKVSDISQMLLVLGRCQSEEEARTFPLPREVNKDTFQYAHGLTPPMHWVRKRRFRKRVNYNEILNVEEEVERLLKADKEWEETGGTVNSDYQSRAEQDASMEPEDFDEEEEDAEGEAIDSVENADYGNEEDMDEDTQDAEALEAALAAGLQEEADTAADLITDSPLPLADQAASMLAAENAMEDSEATPAGTPADTGMNTQDEEPSSDEDESDEDEDEDGPDAYDEDARMRAAERAQQMEEVADLEREIEKSRQKAANMTNQLLKQRELKKYEALQEDLKAKKGVFGLEEEGDDD